ncbi:MAG: SemiSWEET transporter [Pseudomonadota bacterium]
MQSLEVVGYLAAFCTTISFLPQAITTLKTRNTASLSLGMYSLFTIGVILWLAYGIVRQDPILILSNSCTTFLSMLILSMKIKNEWKTWRIYNALVSMNTLKGQAH